MRILVVDDVGYVRHYFDRLLTHHGHQVWTAASGFQALEILKKENTIQVVITDLLMPGMDGLDFYRAAQKIDWRDTAGTLLPRPVFYLITALRPSLAKQQSDDNLLQQALHLGFVEVLLKPIDNEHLLRQLALLEKELPAREPGAAAATNDAELLHVIDQNIERLLCRQDAESLAELADLLHSSLARIPAVQRQHNPARSLPAINGAYTQSAINSPVEPAFATGDLSTGGQLVAQNGLSLEKQ